MQNSLWFKYFHRERHLKRLSGFWMRLWYSVNTNLINIQAIKWIISSTVIGKTSKWKLLLYRTQNFFSRRSWLSKLLVTEPESKPSIYCPEKVVISVTSKSLWPKFCFSLKELISSCLLFYPIPLLILTAPYYVFIWCGYLGHCRLYCPSYIQLLYNDDILKVAQKFQNIKS